MPRDRYFEASGGIPRPPGWSLGPRRVWSLPDAASIEGALTGLPPVVDVADAGSMRGSAVLTLLANLGGQGPGGDIEVLLTKRSSALRNHAGQVSFPGGRIDPDERPVDAAVREATEEVALAPSTVHVYGQLRPHRTRVSNSFIVPVVAQGDRGASLVPNPAEVEQVYWLPLSALVADGAHHSEFWIVDGERHEVHFFDTAHGNGSPDLVWGATAHILVDLLDRVAAEGSTENSG